MNLYFDSFNRTALGSSDSGHVYSSPSPYSAAVISSSKLTNTSATDAALSLFDAGLREFDITITPGTIVGKQFIFYFAGNAALTSGIGVVVAGSSDGVLSDGSITLTDTAVAIDSETGLLIVNASTIRIVATKRNVKVYHGTTKVIDFDTVLYPTAIKMAYYFDTSATAATIDSVTLKALAAQSTARSTIISDIRELLGETDSGNTGHEAAPLLRHLSHVLNDISARIPFIRRSFTVTGAGDSIQEFPLPEDFHKINYVENDGKILTNVSNDARFGTVGPRFDILPQYNRRTRQGYWIDGNRIGFEPALVAAATRDVHYYGLCPPLENDADIPEIPSYLNLAAIYGVLKFCMLKDRDPMAQEYERLYEAEMTKAKGHYNRSQYSELTN
jgi:hypothetical protein